jgi:Ras-related C3 botulinum toxin substrate 1
MQAVKCVVVGDGAVGKTSLLIAYAKDAALKAGFRIPTVLDILSVTTIVDGKTIKLELWDTAGQEDYNKFRPLAYPKTDVFILCFSLDSIVSFDNVRSKWCQEICHYCPSAPIILLGTKYDLVNENRNLVTFCKAIEMKKEIGAIRYLECSAVNQHGSFRGRYKGCPS